MRVGVVDEALTRDLRRSVLRPELLADAPLPGDELADAVHLAVTDDEGRAVSTCFVYAETCPWRPELSAAWHLRQMATAPDRRGRGLGALVIAAAVDAVRDRGGLLLWCNAREAAVAFYRRHGFVGTGELFTDDRHRIPHLRMSREL